MLKTYSRHRRIHEVGKILEHKHLIVRAELNNPPNCTTAIEAWMKKLVKQIDMNILMGPYSVYSDMVGNRGLTAVTIIETSHIALHVWDEVEPALAQLDVYTCSALNIEDVFEAMNEWNPVKVEYKYIDRENQLTLIEKRVI
jgi:S-adenosylmethionine/arginine decarboxylase-like enzyme